MKNTFFLSSNDLGFDLMTLRMVAKSGLKLDLSTGPKGRTEALLVLSKFHAGDIRTSETVQRHISYSFLTVDTPEVCEQIMACLNGVEFSILGQTDQAVILACSATLETWSDRIKVYSSQFTRHSFIKFLNTVQTILEENGYFQLWEKYRKVKIDEHFLLERK